MTAPLKGRSTSLSRLVVPPGRGSSFLLGNSSLRALCALRSGQRCPPAGSRKLPSPGHILGPSGHLLGQGSTRSLHGRSVPALSPASLDRRRLGVWSTAAGPRSGGGLAAGNSQVAGEKHGLSGPPSSSRWPGSPPGCGRRRKPQQDTLRTPR